MRHRFQRRERSVRFRGRTHSDVRRRDIKEFLRLHNREIPKAGHPTPRLKPPLEY